MGCRVMRLVEENAIHSTITHFFFLVHPFNLEAGVVTSTTLYETVWQKYFGHTKKISYTSADILSRHGMGEKADRSTRQMNT